MTVGHRPTIRRRRLRSELRQRREEANLTQEQVASEMEWSLSKLVRIEAGTVSISTNDLRALLGLYGVHDRDLIGELLELARASRQRMWWSGYRNVLSQAYLEFIGFEADASEIRYYHPTVIPALLQTEAYARAIIPQGAVRELEPEDVESLIDVRLTRISEVHGRPDPPELITVLDESVVHRIIGGRGVMREQLRHLVELAARPYVDVRLLPLAVGAHPGLYGSFALLDFVDPADDTVLFLENAPTDMVLKDRPDQVEIYRTVFNRLLDISLGPQETVAAFTRVADALGNDALGTDALGTDALGTD
jgi:transcriptional regulator with XRE-family HTH domain